MFKAVFVQYLSIDGGKLCIPVMVLISWHYFQQINGEDVENREQALKLFSEQRDSLALLVCRPQYQVRMTDCLVWDRQSV